MPELYLFLMLVKITAGSESVTAVMKAVAASEGKHLFLAIILILELLSVEGGWGEFPKLLLQACGSYCVSVVCLQLNRHFIAKRIQFTPESHKEQYTGFKQHN